MHRPVCHWEDVVWGPKSDWGLAHVRLHSQQSDTLGRREVQSAPSELSTTVRGSAEAAIFSRSPSAPVFVSRTFGRAPHSAEMAVSVQ